MNWREGLNNRMSSGSVMANGGFCKSLSKVNILGWQLAAKRTYALDYVFIVCSVYMQVYI